MKRTILASGGGAPAAHAHAESDVTSLASDLAAKAPLASPAFTGTPTGITKAHVGLGNVDNTADTAKPVSTATQTALDAKAAAPPLPPTGHYFYTASPSITQNSVALGNGNLRVTPWLVLRSLSITRLGAEIVTVGDVGSKLRIGIYSDTGSCQPGSLLLDAGQIAGDSATVQELTVSQTLSPGLYWVGAAVQSVTTTQPTVRCCQNWHPPILMGAGTSIPTAGDTPAGYQATGVTGALPGTFTVASFKASPVPRIFAKLA